MFEFLDVKTFLTIIHIFGVALGAGGAYASDLIFLSSIKDERISHTELRLLRIGSVMVWTGLAILFISGSGLFLLDAERYFASAKFLAKMTVVLIIVVNGFFFHFSHIPRIARHVGEHFPSSDEFSRQGSLLMMSGAVSMISWTSAIILGTLRGLPYSYFQIIAIYLGVLVIGVLTAYLIRYRILPEHWKH